MLKRISLAAALLLSSQVALADAPGKGAFGLGATLGTGSAANGVAVAVQPTLRAMYWVTDQFELSGNFGLTSVENVGTNFQFLVGGDYYVVKNPRDSFGAYLGAALGINLVSPTGGNSTTQFVLQAGGGAEYFFNRHFGARVFEGLQFNTERTTFAFISTVGLNWYF